MLRSPGLDCIDRYKPTLTHITPAVSLLKNHLLPVMLKMLKQLLTKEPEGAVDWWDRLNKDTS